jgi:hypothetical protein
VWDRLHFPNGRSKSNTLSSGKHGKMAIKRRMEGLRLKRLRDGVATLFFGGDFG